MRFIVHSLLVATLTFASVGLVLTLVPDSATAQHGKRKAKARKSRAKKKAAIRKDRRRDRRKKAVVRHRHRERAGIHVRNALYRTHLAILVIGKAVRDSDKGLTAFRLAIIYQSAARRAWYAHRPALGLYLTLEARTYLRTAATEAGTDAPPEATVTDDEKGALDEARITDEEKSETKEIVDESTAEVPSEEDLLKTENFGSEPIPEELPDEDAAEDNDGTNQ